MSVLPLATFSAPGVPLFGTGGGGGGTYTAGTNIAINSSNVISVASNPSFTNINTTTLNSNPIPPTYSAGSNISLTGNAIAVSTNPTFSNINVTTINNSAYPPGGGGGTSIRLPLTSQFATGTGLVGGNSTVTIIANFSLVGGHTYLLSWGASIEEQTSNGNWDVFLEIPSFNNYSLSLVRPSSNDGAPLSFSFRAIANASDATIRIINNTANTTSMFITQNPQIGVCVLTDLGTI